ncbi:hypothetical protein FOQG_13222 [Fusarium oxysporum f. sp. raphani 54005]|uniref:Nitroreductase domain-containing protein n=3 Tax=Fusarium oxysporum TaxID=5507 RepID=X0BKY0_FUSOX|nr:hypothetical protein FOVG_12818 [Fusarium oxysporum f. sp. pisi HDV247]EXK82511.1 hypothetical protein FOQG_13222 [Fusarium oxysporum f. sp. raphani 54005]KAG7425700.1 FMN reductase [Fusarium oxysporum f. sp. raphani]
MLSAANLKAAQQVVYSRALAQRGRSRDASSGIKAPLSVRAAVKNNAGSNKSSVARIIKLLEAANVPDAAAVAFPTMGRPRMLTDEENEAIMAFVIWREGAGLPACKGVKLKMQQIHYASAGTQKRSQSAECGTAASVTIILKWFERLTEAIVNRRINASECWNADQTVVRVGILREHVQCLIMHTKREVRVQVLSPEYRETCTVIVRKFLPDEKLPEGALETLTAASQSASTGSMLQSWSAIAVIDPERKSHVATLAGDQEFIREAPLFILFCADLSRLHDASDYHGRPGDGAGLECIDLFIMATLDAALAAQNVTVAAESLGLGMCYVGAARNNARDLPDYLGLPPYVVGLLVMAVSYAEPKYLNSHKPRLSISEVMYRDIWKDEERAEHIKKYKDTLQNHYKRQNKPGRKVWRVSLANCMSSSDLDGRGKMRSVLDQQGFKFT